MQWGATGMVVAGSRFSLLFLSPGRVSMSLSNKKKKEKKVSGLFQYKHSLRRDCPQSAFSTQPSSLGLFVALAA